MSDLRGIGSQRSGDARTAIAQASHFSHQNYNVALRSFKSPALGWFVQFAIRGELHRAYEADWELDGNEYRALPYLKLRERSAQLLQLICRKHILDEFALAGIGMTLYDFPILFTFFGGADCRNFVREPTVHEIARYVLEMFQMLMSTDSDSRLAIPEMSVDEIGTRIKHMTRTQVEDLGGRKQDVSSSTRRLLSVNMAAPVSVLKAQFLDILERSAKQKNEIAVMIGTWLRYGVLPFIDLRECIAREAMKAISINKQLKLIYDPEFARYNKKGEELERGAKTLSETTKPHALNMLNFQSQPFCALAAAASREFHDAVTFARDPDQCSDRDAGSEALRRWIPRTYPYNLTAIELAMEVEPERAPQLQEFRKHVEKSGQLSWSTAERIRSDSTHAENSWITSLVNSGKDDAEFPISVAENDDFESDLESDNEAESDWFMSLFDGEWDRG